LLGWVRWSTHGGALVTLPFSERENKMAKTNHWGVLAAAAGTLVAVGLVVLIMLVVVEARPAEATFPGKPAKIAYSGKDAPNGDYEIYTINAGGGGRIQLTDNSTNDNEPSYSPSGDKIAYSGKDAPNADYEIYTINAGGGGRFNVTDNSTDDTEPSWGSS
jgi:Tol biopolymer transport system component